MLDQLLSQLGRVNERTGLRRRIHPRNLESVQWFRRISERNVHRADRVAGVIQKLPHSGRTARCSVRVLHRVTAVFRFDEMKDAVFARIFPGHERRPGRRSNRRENGLQHARDAGFHQLRQIRHFAFRHRWPDNCPSCGVQADDDHLRNLLHVMITLNFTQASVKLRGRDSRSTFICKPSKSACRPGRIENPSLKFRVRSNAPGQCAVC